MSSSTIPYLRRMRVTFENLAGQTKTYESDGTQSNLRISARVEKTIQSLPGASTLSVYNLSADTRGGFERGKTKVSIEAGWDDGGGLTRCFYGAVVTAVSRRAGADIVTSIEAVSGLEALQNAYIKKTWPAGTSVRDICKDIVGQLDGVKFVPSKCCGMESIKVKGEKGWSVALPPKQALDVLSKEFGFCWTIADDDFMCAKDRTSIGDADTIRDPFLIDINPVFTGQRMQKIANGLKIRCTFKPTVYPMFGVAVESQIEPRYNGGGYIVQRVAHNLDPWNASSFTTEIDAVMAPGSGKTAAVNGLK